jgi:predicted MFS family arabinose efflux permease
MAALSVALYAALADYRPGASTLNYGGILHSLLPLLVRTPLLRRRAAYHAAIYSGFSLFWTSVPLLLAEPPFSFTQKGIGLFALFGAAGAAAAPLAGRAGDRGWTSEATGAALCATGIGFGFAFIAAETHSTILLAGAAVVLDVALAASLVLSQRAILNIGSTAGNRLNSLFRMLFLASGAAGSAVAGYVYTTGGWSSVTRIGVGLAVAGLLFYLTELETCQRFVTWRHIRRQCRVLVSTDDRLRKDLGYPTVANAPVITQRFGTDEER